MIPNASDQVATLERGISESITMRIDSDAMAHVMSQLTALYTNQRLAVMREYSTNAWDSHVEAGRSHVPIEVTLPSYEAPFLVIKDTGLGLDVDDLRDIYSSYGTSTKRQSNLVNGMMGFGCKAGLAYATQFQVIAVKDGVKTSALVSKNEQGVGVIDIMSIVPAPTAHNGVTIKVPVPAADFHAMESTADEFFPYWEKGTVLVNGEQPVSIRDEKTNAIWIDDNTYVTLGGFGDSHKIIMGNVAYPAKLPRFSFRTNVCVTAWVNMGDVVFTPSREGLKENDPRTQECVQALHDYVTERLPQIIAERVKEQADSPWAECKLARQWIDLLPRQFNKNYVPVTPIDSNVWHVGSAFDVERRSDRTTAGGVSQHLHNEATYVIVDYPHSNVSGSVKRRLHKLTGSEKRIEAWILLPAGTTNIGFLEGRPNVYKWEDVPEADKADRPEREKREGGYKYIVVRPDGSTYEAPVLTEPKLCYGTPDKGRWSNHQSTYRTWAQALGLHYVELTPRQVEKFTRNHPWAVEVVSTYHAEADKARKAVTAADKAHYHFVHYEASPFQQYGPVVDQIEDPELRKLVERATTTSLSPAMERAIAFGYSPSGLTSDGQAEVIKARYPLLTWDRYGRTIDPVEALVYINAKYQSI
jgi:hypothetical protein